MILEPTNTVESNPSQPEIPTAETNQSPAANIAPGTETPTEMETPINESPRSETQPPVRDVVQRSDADVVAPSPLTTLDSSSSYEQQNQVSIHQIRFEQAENGVSLSVPVANDYVFPSNNNVDTYTDGLDSDGEVGPFFDAVAEEKDYSDEEDENEDIGIGGPVQVVPPSTDAPLIPPITATGNDATLPSLTEVEVMAMTVNQLKDELAKRKLSKNGVKATLQQRLKKARPISNFTLDPATGLLKGRLDSNFHFIVPSQSKYPVCALCRWANSDEDNDRSAARVRGKSIGTCDVCNVNLCLKCFKIFHTVGNLDKLRSEVRKE